VRPGPGAIKCRRHHGTAARLALISRSRDPLRRPSIRPRRSRSRCATP
jgi:hypothetical protein